MMCPECNSDFDRLGTHLSLGSCDYPKISNQNKRILKGVLMGDSWIPSSYRNNPQMILDMCNKDFLTHFQKKLGWLCSSVNMIRTAEKSAENNRRQGFRPNANSKDYSNVYRLTTITHPWFRNIRDNWYIGSNKNIPVEKISPSPKLLKMWYVSDGGYLKRDKRNPYAYFRLDSHSHKAKHFSKLLTRVGVKNNIRDNGNVIAITTDSTEKFLNYIGDPEIGFEYKWGL